MYNDGTTFLTLLQSFASIGCLLGGVTVLVLSLSTKLKLEKEEARVIAEVEKQAA
jgi:hypothetical protein